MEKVIDELHKIVQEITSKVYSRDWQDVEELEYWQGKKDGIRLALVLLGEYDSEALANKLNSRFVRGEAKILGIKEDE